MSTYSPAGSTTVLNATSTASNAWVTSLQPVNCYHVVNTGSAPVMIRMNANTAASVTAVFPTAGSPQIGFVVGPTWEDIVVVPSALNGQASPQPAGFNSNCQFSVITAAGTTANVFITPVLAF
jgi:hypothetical protein